MFILFFSLISVTVSSGKPFINSAFELITLRSRTKELLLFTHDFSGQEKNSWIAGYCFLPGAAFFARLLKRSFSIRLNNWMLLTQECGFTDGDGETNQVGYLWINGSRLIFQVVMSQASPIVPQKFRTNYGRISPSPPQDMVLGFLGLLSVRWVFLGSLSDIFHYHTSL